MRKIHLEMDVETEDLINGQLLRLAIISVIERMFFTDTKVTKLVVIEDDIPAEGIQTEGNIRKSTT